MKYRKFLFLGLLALCLTGCHQMQIGSEKDIPKSFYCTADVSIGNKIFKCNIARQEQGLLQIDMLSPESVKDLSFKWLGDKYEFSHKDLKCTKDTNILPNVSFATELKDILTYIANNETMELKNKNEDISEYIGTIGKNNFNFLVDNNGSIQKIWSDDFGWSAQISGFNATNAENNSPN